VGSEVKRFLPATVWALLCLSACAQTGVFTTYQTTWDGIGRQYSVYVPNLLHNPPALVVCLHATVNASSTAPPLTYCRQDIGWERIADRYSFLPYQKRSGGSSSRTPSFLERGAPPAPPGMDGDLARYRLGFLYPQTSLIHNREHRRPFTAV